MSNPSSLPKIVFMGTPVFAVTALKGLYEAGYPIVAVYSQPPKPVGRGYKVTPCPVHVYAESMEIPVYTPQSLRPADVQEVFRSHGADLGIVAAYGLILPKAILEAPQYGCLNIHGSLLPRWRGAAPIQRSIMAGDAETGITIMKMDEGLDTGPMLTKGVVSITPQTACLHLHDALSELGAKLLLETIPGYVDGSITLETQPEEGITYAHKLSKEESHLDWNRSAWELDCQIRGSSMWPGTYFVHAGTTFKVSKALVVERNFTESVLPGTVLDDQLTIACGSGGALRLLTVQKPGGKWLSAEEFLRGYALPQGILLPGIETSCLATN